MRLAVSAQPEVVVDWFHGASRTGEVKVIFSEQVCAFYSHEILVRVDIL
jgi:hypothetical protein